MLATYASFLAVFASSALVGQAIVTACGRRAWSPLAPAGGLAALVALAGGAVHLPGRGTAVLAATGACLALSVLYLPGRVGGGRELLPAAVPIVGVGLVAATLPFIVEGRFGILGTGFNVPMGDRFYLLPQVHWSRVDADLVFSRDVPGDTRTRTAQPKYVSGGIAVGFRLGR
jgi:hypothetical protein